MASGGMAVVYRAIQDSLERTVAIKALKTSISTDPATVTRFEREAQSLAALQHENIVHVYNFIRERGALFMVMEYVQGIDVYDLIDTCQRIPYDVAAIVCMKIARALDYVHYQGILHRDIKPANIIVSRQGGVKLMDFGIARDEALSDLTQTGTGIGTPAYMSPEQIIGDNLDARSDIFSLGIVLYQMVTGQKPFVEDDTSSVMRKIRIEPHTPVRKINPDVPRPLERIIDRCLAKQSRGRFRSAQSLVMALERFLAKYVDMNYSARLVVFLRHNDVITELEAKEYLNPALGGHSLAGKTNLAARQSLRRGAVLQGSIMAVAALLVSIFHIAPIGVAHTEPIQDTKTGYVLPVIHPWGHVSIGDQKIATTPTATPIPLSVGKHTLVISNQYYPSVSKTITVVESLPEEASLLIVDLNKATVKTNSLPEDNQ